MSFGALLITSKPDIVQVRAVWRQAICMPGSMVLVLRLVMLPGMHMACLHHLVM